jgi:hypothetical protein
MGKKFGISFSWKRAVGISGLKNKISRNRPSKSNSGGKNE